MAESIIKPLEPKGDGWRCLGRVPPQFTMGYEGYYWLHDERRLSVMSCVEVANDPDDIDKGPEYHVSITRFVNHSPARCDRNDARFAIKAFGLEGADEDNHVPGGKARNYWMPVAESLRGHVCPCKDEEPAMVEDKGDYVWRGLTK